MEKSINEQDKNESNTTKKLTWKEFFEMLDKIDIPDDFMSDRELVDKPEIDIFADWEEN